MCLFIFIGWAILFLAIFKDTAEFWMHLYCRSFISLKEKFQMENLTMKDFNRFEEMMLEIEGEHNQESDESMIDIAEVVKKIREGLQVGDALR